MEIVEGVYCEYSSKNDTALGNRLIPGISLLFSIREMHQS